MTEKSKKALCKGCLTFENDVCKIFDWMIVEILKDEQCPCVTCLVKSTCTSGCEIYHAFHRHVDFVVATMFRGDVT